VVQAVEDGLDRILVNLVGNAVKYTPAGGQVTVGLCQTGDEAFVTVTDTGIGIPPEAQAHLFEEFYRAPNAREAKIIGTGLGLAIVKRLVELYHGTIAVESQIGVGSTFTVVFPVYALP
jgi:two-component system phosphate regulon sensor histidine kinase PhoR